MENFDNLPIEEKIKRINEFSEKLAEAAKPVVEHLVKVFQEFSKAAALAVDVFKRGYMSEIKKERHRKAYYRMMRRRK